MLRKTGIIISIVLGLILASAAICVSIILFSKGSQKKLTGLTGILANTLLLIGDFTVGFDSKIIPALFGLGYILETIWIFMLAVIFNQTEIQNNIKEKQTLF